MSQENVDCNSSTPALEQGMSKLALNRNKRRPNRAFHNLSLGNIPKNQIPLPPYGQLPTPGPDGSFEAASMQRIFTPKQFDSPINTPSTSKVINQESFLNPVPNSLPIQSMSHILATQRWEDQLQYISSAFETSKNSIPPLATTQFYCSDQGTCDPRLMSLSMYTIPKNEHMRSATKLPLGITLQPFAQLIPEAVIPLCDATQENGPLRCNRCRAYINPGFQFTHDSAVICNICKVKNKLPAEHFAPLGPDGQRSDIASRVELFKGCVDFAVPDFYNVNKNEKALPLHYVFLIDVSLLANENNSSLAAVEGVRTAIEHIADFQTNCKIAIISYDSKLKFYNLRPELEGAQEYVVTETDNVFLPFYHGLFVKPQDSMRVINDTLRKISEFITMDKYCHVPQVCYGSALEAAKLALDTATNKQGGKIICTLNSLPTNGNGNLILRKDDTSKNHLRCDNEFYRKFARDMLSTYVSLDLYITSAAFVDMVSVAHPVLVTSGSLKYYPHFRYDQDEFTLVNDMLENVSKIVGYQSILKVRCSNGLGIYQYYSESVDGSDRDPIIPVLTTDTTIDILLKYVEKMKEGTDLHFQAALLYTDIDGNRKVRSINTNGAVSGNIREVFKFLNQNVIMRIMIKDVLNVLGDCDFVKIRQSIDDKMVEVLTQYRALISGNSSSQLVLPDTLKTLPTYMLAFQKSELMKPNVQSTRGNDRVYDLFKYHTFNGAQLSYKLYPQIIPTHVLLEEKDLSFYDANYKLLQIKPSTLENISVRNSHSQFVNGGCYFIFKGDIVYLWFNENTNRLLLKDLLEVDESVPTNQIPLLSGSLPSTGTQVNEKAASIIKNWSQVTNTPTLQVLLLRPNVDQYYGAVMSSIVCEDPTMNKVEGSDNYLVTLHRRIQENLKKQNYVKVD